MLYWNPIQWNCCHARVPLDKNQSQQREKVGSSSHSIAGQLKIFRQFAWPALAQRSMSGINWTPFSAVNGRIARTCPTPPIPEPRRTLFNWGTRLRRVASNQKQTTTNGWQATPDNCPLDSVGRTANIGDCGVPKAARRMRGFDGNRINWMGEVTKTAVKIRADII